MNVAAAISGVTLDATYFQRRAEGMMFALEEVITKPMSDTSYDREGGKPAEMIEESKAFRPSQRRPSRRNTVLNGAISSEMRNNRLS